MKVPPALLLSLLVAAACDRTESGASDPPTKAAASPDDADASKTDAKAPADEGEHGDDGEAKPPADAPKEPGPPAGRGGTDELSELEGKTEAQLVERFGKPTHERAFAMADCCHEFEIELYNTYPPGKGHDGVQIHEWTWDYDGYKLTVWTHKPAADWVVLDTIRYADDVEF